MSTLPQVPTSALAPEEDNITDYPLRADDQDVSQKVTIHYQSDWLFPHYISDALAMLDHYPAGDPISQTHRDSEAPRGILKAPKLEENISQPPAARYPEFSGPWLPKYFNPRKRQREVESDETEDDREPRRHGIFPAPPRPFKRPRFSSYSLEASRVDVPRSSWICGVDSVAGTKRPRSARDDVFGRVDLDEKRPAPGVRFSGSQVIYGFICANSIDDTAPIAEFEPIPQFPPVLQSGSGEPRTNPLVETDTVDNVSTEPVAEIEKRSVPFTRKAVQYLDSLPPTAKKLEERARAEDPAPQMAHNDKKWRSWFKWMVRRQTANCRHQHRRDLEVLEERLCEAKTPRAVEIAELGLSAFKARWKMAVKEPQNAMAVGDTWRKIKDLWPHLYPISASDLLQEVVTAMDTLSEQQEEPPMIVEPAAAYEDSFSPAASLSPHSSPLDSNPLPPPSVPYAEEYTRAVFHWDSPQPGASLAAEAGPSSCSTPVPDTPPLSPVPSVEEDTQAVLYSNSPQAVAGPSSQLAAPAPSVGLPSEDLQDVPPAPMEAPAEVQVLPRRPPMSLRSGLQVTYRPKPRQPRTTQANHTVPTLSTGATRRPRGKAKR